MIEAANRLDHIEEYYFSKKLREIAAMISNGKPVINIGVGSPDLQPPQAIIDVLKNSLLDDKAHQYQSYKGIPELRTAISRFYQTHYQVTLDANTEVLPLIGSKEGVMHVSMAFLNPGDAVLIPNPGYPTYATVTNLVGAKPVFYELSETNNWLPDLEALEQQDLSKVKLMWINYPHMPTGAQADQEFFEKLVAFAKTHKILIVNDNPYSFILNNQPTSFLSVKGAKDVGLELNSLSKTFNMSGWRIGMVLGQSKYIDSVLKVKSNMDSGMFYALQKGAAQALDLEDDWFAEINKIYERRRQLVWQLADALGCAYDKNSSGMFVWAKLPKGATNSKEFIEPILQEKHVFITPGSIFGSQGEGYIRFSLCVDESQIQEAINRI